MNNKEKQLFNKLYRLFILNKTKNLDIIKYDNKDNKLNKNTLYLVPSYISGEKDIYVKSFILSKKLKKFGFTPQLYYDVFILGISSIEDRPKCIICGKEAIFDNKNPYVRGYLKSCENPTHKKLAMTAILQLKDNREKQRLSHKGWKPSKELRDRWSKQRTGKKKHFKKEFIDYLKNRNKNFIWTQDRRNKISDKILEKLKTSPNSRKNFKKGWYKSDITGETYHYDSSWEYKFLIYLEKIYKKGYIKSFKRCTEFVSYKSDDGFYHKYIPDFTIILENNIEVIIEIKPVSLLKKSRKVFLKKIAGIKHFLKEKKKYIVLTENELFKNINGSFNIFDHIV